MPFTILKAICITAQTYDSMRIFIFSATEKSGSERRTNTHRARKHRIAAVSGNVLLNQLFSIFMTPVFFSVCSQERMERTIHISGGQL